MQFLLYIITAVGILLFSVKKRSFDFFTIAFISSVMYFLPGYFGYALSPYTHLPVRLNDKTYLVMIIVLLSIILFSTLNDLIIKEKHKNIDYSHLTEKIYIFFLTLIVLVSFVLMVISSGSNLFDPQKQNVMTSLNRFHILWVSSLSLLTITSFLTKRKKILIFCLVFFLFDVYIGFRSTFAITLLSIATIHIYKMGAVRLISKWKTIVIGISLSVFFFGYKQVYINVKLGEWNEVKNALFSGDFLTKAIINSEPFTTQIILNRIIESKYFVGLDHHVNLIYTFIPVNFFIDSPVIDFNDLHQNDLFPGLYFGMANNIWAEMYSTGGWLFLILFILFFNIILITGNNLLRMNNPHILGMILLIYINWSFYIHRNSLSYELNLIKRIFLVWFMVFIIAFIITKLVKKKEGIIYVHQHKKK